MMRNLMRRTNTNRAEGASSVSMPYLQPTAARIFARGIQRTAAVSEWHPLSEAPKQTTLAGRPAHDRYEREADRIARHVVSMPESVVAAPATLQSSASLQRKCACGGSGDEECTCRMQGSLQRMAREETLQTTWHPLVHEVLSTPGQPVHQDARTFFEPRFGRDFSAVRVHVDPRAAESAAAVNALAYTVGRHVVFGAGQYAPREKNGQFLFAHELTHVLQQTDSEHNLQSGARPVGALSPQLTADMTDGTDLDGEFVDGMIATFQPACFDGGGASQCNPDTGNYDILSNANSCCSRECTQSHEERHVADLGDCCLSLSAAIKAGGDKGTLVGRYNTWMRSGALAWSECNAHTGSVSCLENLFAANGCDNRSSQCCDEISQDLAAHRRTKTSWCAKSPATRPACPF
jgi:hypothetical protein